MFRTKTQPTATPDERPRDFPAGHDDPQSLFYVPPGLRPYYRDVAEPRRELLARAQKFLSYELAEQEAAAVQRPVVEREIARAKNNAAGSPKQVADLRRKWYTEDGKFRPRHIEREGHTINYERGLLTVEEEERARHMALLDRCNHKKREERNKRQFRSRNTCGVCGERAESNSLKRMYDVARACRKCHATAELLRAMAWQHEQLPNGQTRGDAVAPVIERHQSARPLNATVIPKLTPTQEQA